MQLFFSAGNAWTDPAIDNEGAIDFWYGHAIISQDTRDKLKQACNFSSVGPLTKPDSKLEKSDVKPSVGLT